MKRINSQSARILYLPVCLVTLIITYLFSLVFELDSIFKLVIIDSQIAFPFVLVCLSIFDIAKFKGKASKIILTAITIITMLIQLYMIVISTRTFFLSSYLIQKL